MEENKKKPENSEELTIELEEFKELMKTRESVLKKLLEQIKEDNKKQKQEFVQENENNTTNIFY